MLEQIVWQQIEWVNIYAFSFSRFSPVVHIFRINYNRKTTRDVGQKWQ